jgi:anti-sigma factor RsiW
MTCRELAEFLADYLARALGPEEPAIFDRHLAECADCAAYLRSYAATVRLVKQAYDDDPVPADVPDGLVRAIVEARKRS